MRYYFGYVLAIVALVILTGAFGFYWIEAGRNPNVQSFGDGLWWALVTMTTVGYGDIVPTTTFGRTIGAFLMFAGIGTVGVSTAAIAAYLIRLDRLDALRIHGFRDHVIVCGLGSAGQVLAQAFAKGGYRVLAIEKDESNPHISASRDSGIAVLVGNAARAETLRRARLDRARHLIVVCGSDSNNVEIAAQARAIPRSVTPGLSCSTEIRDPELWYALGTWELGTRDAFRLEFFNLSELGARALLARHPPFARPPVSVAGSTATVADDAPPRADARVPHVLIVGASALSRHLIRHMVRQWKDTGPAADPLRITLVDGNAGTVCEHLLHRHPELKTLAAINALTMDLQSPQFQHAAFLFDAGGRCDITQVYVCVEDERLGLSTGLHLMNHVRRFGIPVVVRMDRQGGLTTLLGEDGGGKRGRAFEGFHVFGLLEQACQPELVLRGTNELLARALHEDYVARLPPDSTNPARVKWDDLPVDMKESNRTQADHIVTKLEAVGCYIVPLTAFEADPFTFAPEEVQRLAVMEHERWVAERRALGWTAGPRDPDKRTNPNLVAWDQLDESTQNMNRDFVRQLPTFLNRAGFTVRRYQV
jgi:voltage-gated potassium channel Kch